MRTGVLTDDKETYLYYLAFCSICITLTFTYLVALSPLFTPFQTLLFDIVITFGPDYAPSFTPCLHRPSTSLLSCLHFPLSDQSLSTFTVPHFFSPSFCFSLPTPSTILQLYFILLRLSPHCLGEARHMGQLLAPLWYDKGTPGAGAKTRAWT